MPDTRTGITRYEVVQLIEQRIGQALRGGASNSAGITALTAGMAARRTRVVVGATTGIIALGASADVVCTWSSAFTDATYLTDVSPSVGLIGNGTTSVISKTVSSVTVRVTASVLLAAGATFVCVGMC